MDRPWTGNGFMSFKDNPPDVPLLGDLRLPSAHNEVLNWLVQVGIIGAILGLCVFGGFLWVTLRYRRRPRPETALLLSLWCYWAIRSVTEGSVTDFLIPVQLLLLLSWWASRPTQAHFPLQRSKSLTA